jgi:hypothetical protein
VFSPLPHHVEPPGAPVGRGRVLDGITDHVTDNQAHSAVEAFIAA